MRQARYYWFELVYTSITDHFLNTKVMFEYLILWSYFLDFENTGVYVSKLNYNKLTDALNLLFLLGIKSVAIVRR